MSIAQILFVASLCALVLPIVAGVPAAIIGYTRFRRRPAG
jgi:hypothetical protein